MTTKQTSLNTKQACEVFAISNMTLLAWRKGSAKKAPLPVLAAKNSDTKPTVRFSAPQLKAWAKKHGVTIAKAPEDFLANVDSPEAAKPGPKRRVTVDAAPAVKAKKSPAKQVVKAKPRRVSAKSAGQAALASVA